MTKQDRQQMATVRAATRRLRIAKPTERDINAIGDNIRDHGSNLSPSTISWVINKVTADKKYVHGVRLPVTYLGRYTDSRGRHYKVYTPLGLRLSAWVRLEPVDGGRARSAYNSGDPIGRAIAEQLRRGLHHLAVETAREEEVRN